MSCGSSQAFVIRAGDLLPVIEVVAEVECGDVVDFTGWTDLKFIAEGPRTIEGTATGDAEGVLTFAWGPGTTDAPGTYHGRFRGLSPDGKRQTFPTRGAILVEIVP